MQGLQKSLLDSRVPLTGPTLEVEVEIVLNCDLLVVLAYQHQPLGEVFSSSLKAQNRTVKPSALSCEGDDFKAS